MSRVIQCLMSFRVYCRSVSGVVPSPILLCHSVSTIDSSLVLLCVSCCSVRVRCWCRSLSSMICVACRSVSCIVPCSVSRIVPCVVTFSVCRLVSFSVLCHSKSDLVSFSVCCSASGVIVPCCVLSVSWRTPFRVPVTSTLSFGGGRFSHHQSVSISHTVIRDREQHIPGTCISYRKLQ
jgi:hypothetical protein